MNIILRQDVSNLGRIGELVTVKDGYARNFLIPRNQAYFASEKAIRALEIEKKKISKRLAKEKITAEEISQKLAELQISIPMKVGEEGRLYGAVTSQMVAHELNLRGFEIDKRQIIIDESIKNLGVFDIRVKLHPEVYSTLKIWVINEE
jgi:large subunit ribosomal protein L9